MKKILLISNMYPSEGSPFYGIFVKRTEEMLDDSFEISKVIMTKPSNNYKKVISYIVHYIRVFKECIKLEKESIIYCHYSSLNAPPIIFASFFKKNKLVVNVHGSDIFYEKRRQKVFHFFNKKLFQINPNVIVPSKYFREVMLNKYDIPSHKLYISPSGGINRDLFNRHTNDVNTEDFNWYNSEYDYIVYVSRLDYGKGWDDILYAFSSYVNENPKNNKRLVIVGSGKYSKEVNLLIKELDLLERVIILPALSQEKIAALFPLAYLFVFPTKREGESLGLIGLEALSSGLPIIGSEIGGLVEYISDGSNGYLFKPGEINQIKECLMRFENLSEKEKEQMRKVARESTEKYDRKKIKIQLTAFFNTL
ncbi:glycosyltransferase family 4 protein [Priestia aryabhattai]|uniref:glycosyltransferase family 4 protein n=1 Tax=Priestia aryabhattai TaxID=412384 RepID=UPI003D267B00